MFDISFLIYQTFIEIEDDINIIIENVIISNEDNAKLVHPKNLLNKAGKRISSSL